MSLGKMGLVQAGSPDKQCPTLAELTADATATASQIAEGATAYVKGQKITGTMPTTIDVAAEGIKFGNSSFEEVPEIFDFSNVRSIFNMFSSCVNLSIVPTQLDLDNLEVISGGFQNTGITSIDLTLSKATLAGSAFHLSKLSNVIKFVAPSIIDANLLFNQTDLTDIGIIELPVCTNLRQAFANCPFSLFPKITAPSVENCINTFYGCRFMQSLEYWDFSNVTEAGNMFNGCTNLTTIGNIIFLNTSLSLADSPNLDKDTLYILGTLATEPGQTGVAALKSLGLPAQTLTFNTAAQEFLESEGIIAKLTDENWTVNFAESM